MTSQELRKKFLEFFETKGHTKIPSASLIPENDPTVLFTTAGMHPLVPYLLGEKHPGGNKIASCQKCIRTVDIDEVGDTTHLTFFEMLGNWSFGDYFKDKAIEMSFEFLTSPQWLGINKNLLAVSVFAGDDDAPFDVDAFEKWKSLEISEKRIARLPKKNNWWGPAGQTGPCGPDTEMFYWTGDPQSVPESFNDDNPLWVEIWNDVFMQYNKTNKGLYEPLVQKNVDTGMGLERVVAVLNNSDIYATDTIKPIIDEIIALSWQEKKYKTDPSVTRAIRIIADHVRAAVFILGDDHNIVPSNIGQGYVVRRLIRRAIRYGTTIGITMSPFIVLLGQKVIDASKDTYSELQNHQARILSELEKEEIKFQSTIANGLKEFSKLSTVDGKAAFNLYQSYGFPIELTEELAREKGISINKEEFEEELKKHQELSRSTSAGAFKGGLADHSEITTKYHTATHLLLAALRTILGPETYQKGSNITAERLRFDFNYSQKLTPEQIKEVEDLVNKKIKEDIPVEMLEMPKQEALTSVKVSFDPAKYGEVVKVYKIGDFSAELCGGPHVQHTGQIGVFHIIKEEAVSGGIRRIRAVVNEVHENK